MASSAFKSLSCSRSQNTWPRFLAIAAFLFLLSGTSSWASDWEKIEKYQVIDAVSLWVTPNETKTDPNEFKLQSFPERAAQQLRLAWIDSARASANRPVPKFLDLPLPYLKLRQEWLRWIRQVTDVAEPAKAAFEKLLESKKEKLRYREISEAAPPRKSDTPHGALWVELEAGGTDVSRHLVQKGWAIPFLPPGVKEPKNWETRLNDMQDAMNNCRGMWKQILTQCRGK